MATLVTTEVRNFIAGRWVAPSGGPGLELFNPATGEPLGHSPAGSPAEVDAAVAAAQAAFPAWRSSPAADRVQFLFKLKNLLETHFDQLAALITTENGKTLAEAKGELRRGIENVEVACGIPVLMQGYSLEDVAPGIDEIMVRQPLGVCAVITPFNFPLMIPLWFLPYAIATGNTVVLKPSDRVPFSAARLIELIHETGLPAGVVNLVNGGKTAVDALLDHPLVRAVSFVGSTPVARHVYTRGSASGKRVQCQGGAKNHVVVLPDADPETTTKIIADSAFGCAGQRCLAVSVTVTVGESKNWFPESIAAAAASLKVGNGLDPATQMGPVITAASRDRVMSLIGEGATQGAKTIVDGRNINTAAGSFVGPTVLDGLPADSALMDTEIFGPVLSVVHADIGRRRHCHDRPLRLRQRQFHLHLVGSRRAQVPHRSLHRQRRRQHRRPRPHGLLPLLWMERQFLRRHACPGTRRRRVLHRQKSHRRKMAAGMVAQVLKHSAPKQTREPQNICRSRVSACIPI